MLFSAFADAQNADLKWVKQIGGIGADEIQDIKLDATGYIYTTGYFSYTTDFDPGPGVFNLTAIEDEDVFVCKMDTAGNLIWVKQFGGLRYQSGLSIAVDAAGNVYTGGIFFATVDFDPGAGIYELRSIGQEDAFVCKLNANGDFVWAISFGGSYTDRINSLAPDGNSNIIITGYFNESVDKLLIPFFFIVFPFSCLTAQYFFTV